MSLLNKLKKIGADTVGEVKDAIKGDTAGECPNCESSGVEFTSIMGEASEVGKTEDLILNMKCVECNFKYEMHYIFNGNV